MTIVSEMQAAVTKAVTNMDRLDEFVNGDATTDVTTDTGVVPSLAKIVAEIGDIATLTTEATDAAAAALAAVGTYTLEYIVQVQTPTGVLPGGVPLAISIPRPGTLSRVYAAILEGTGGAQVGLLVNDVPVYAPAVASLATPLNANPAVAVLAGDTVKAIVPAVDSTVIMLVIKVEISL